MGQMQTKILGKLREMSRPQASTSPTSRDWTATPARRSPDPEMMETVIHAGQIDAAWGQWWDGSWCRRRTNWAAGLEVEFAKEDMPSAYLLRYWSLGELSPRRDRGRAAWAGAPRGRPGVGSGPWPRRQAPMASRLVGVGALRDPEVRPYAVPKRSQAHNRGTQANLRTYSPGGTQGPSDRSPR